MSTVLTVKAYAKINLALDVIAKRPDGYHEVAMVMQTIDLADSVRFKKQDGDITVTANILALACDDSNLAYRAAALLKDIYGVEQGVHITLEKKIPMAAGLAGGSADAAAVLVGLNCLWELGLSLDRLCDLGAALGSDVPFCLRGGTMLAEGRGEKLTALPLLPECFVVLAKPAVNVSTAWVYSNFRAGAVVDRPDIAAMVTCLEDGSLTGVADRLCNALESVTIPEHPDIGKIKKYMCDYGAIGSLMSGSGPTVFGLTQQANEAEFIASKLRALTDAEIIIAKTVSKVGDNVGTEIVAD